MMKYIRPLISLLSIGGGFLVSNNIMPKRLVAAIMRSIALVLLCCFMLMVVVLTGLAALYLYATQNLGYDPIETISVLAAGVTVLFVVCTVLTAANIRKSLGEIGTGMNTSLPLPTHIANQASSAAQAFVDGLMDRKIRK